jgi:hypothetical protein
MPQDEMVARVFASSQRRLGGRRLASPEDRDLIAGYLEGGLDHFLQHRYGEAVHCLGLVASRTLRSFVVSDRGTALLAAPGTASVPLADLTLDQRLGALLELNAHLRTNFGFLSGLHHEDRRRELHREEALLAVFAFQQVMDEVVRLSRQSKADPAGAVR